MSTTLYRKYRPQSFADVVGQKHIVTTLTNALKLGRVGQAYLFTGPRGTGKTTLARLFAKAVNCSGRGKTAEPCGKCEHCLLMAENRSFDVIEIDAASHTGVDNIRELRETITLPPTLGSHKIYIIDEVHMLSTGAFNALLKTLEEPPAHILFILATTALHKVPDTIVSRCQRFDLSRFTVPTIVDKLTMIAKSEKLKIEKPALEMIALTAEGGMRDAESLLMQITSLETSPITEDTVIEVLGTTKKENLIRLLRLISQNELYPALSFVRELSQDGADLAVFGSALLHMLRDLLLVSADPTNGPAALDHLTDEQTATLLDLTKSFSPDRIIVMLELFQIAQRDTKTAVIPELPLEIAIVKVLSFSPAPLSKGSSRVGEGEGFKKSDEALPNKNGAETVLKPSHSDGIAKSAPSLPAPLLQKKSPARHADASQTGGSRLPAVKGVIAGEGFEKANEANEARGANAADLELSTVQENWQNILDKAKELNASLTLALTTAHPLETNGSTLTIGVKYPFHKERLDEATNKLTLKQAFDSILGTDIRLHIALEHSPSTSPLKANEAREASPAAPNPLVTQAMELLGGKLVHDN